MATVWYLLKSSSLNVVSFDNCRLVATLGPKSNLKKVNRKAILDVDVPKACETILTPEAPMALRLQSNLLSVPETCIAKDVQADQILTCTVTVSLVFTHSNVATSSQTLKALRIT